MREMRFHYGNGLVVLRICAPLEGALVAKNALCWQQCGFFTHASLPIVQTRGGQTCSMEESFVENQKHPRAAKPVCSVNTNTVKSASFTLNDVHYSNCRYKVLV